MPPITFDPPSGFFDLSPKERKALRKKWRHDPKTIAAREAARRATAEKFDETLDHFVLSPVLRLIEPELRAAILDVDPQDEDDTEDIIDDTLDKLVKKLDTLASFENLQRFPVIGATAAALAEVWSDRTIEKARDRLEFLLRNKLEELLNQHSRR